MSRRFWILMRFFSKPLGTVVFLFPLLLFFWLGYLYGVAQNTEQCAVRAFESRSVIDEAKPKTVGHRAELLVLIFSAPGNIERRETIRKTWLMLKGRRSILHFFVIGVASVDSTTKTDLVKESASNKDLVLLRKVSDSYSKLSKKLLESLRWADLHASYTFLLKVDDDSFVRLDMLYNDLSEKPRERLYLGFFDGRAQVKTRGKWMEENWNLCDTYLPYAKGGGYVLTADLIRYLSTNIDIFSLYKNEDVSLGAWLAPLNVRRIHDPNFDTEFQSRGCFNSYKVTHKQTEVMMQKKYRNIMTKGRMCPLEYRNKLSYVYNWNVLPSQCCVRNDSTVP